MYGYPQLNPYAQSPYFQQLSPETQRQEVVKVNGENGARTYQIGPNSSAILLDKSGLMIWLVTTDGAGYKTVAAYDITPHQIQENANYTDLESRIKKLEEMIIDGNTADSAAAGTKPADTRTTTSKADV